MCGIDPAHAIGRCQGQEKRVSITLRTTEGEYGEMSVTIVAATDPKAAKVIQPPLFYMFPVWSIAVQRNCFTYRHISAAHHMMTSHHCSRFRLFADMICMTDGND